MALANGTFLSIGSGIHLLFKLKILGKNSKIDQKGFQLSSYSDHRKCKSEEQHGEKKVKPTIYKNGIKDGVKSWEQEVGRVHLEKGK